MPATRVSLPAICDDDASWPSADTSVPVTTSKVHTSINTNNLFIPFLPLDRSMLILTLVFALVLWQTPFLSRKSLRLFEEDGA